MFDLQKTKRAHTLVGMKKDGSICDVPSLLCIRKHLDPKHKELKKLLKHDISKLCAFVSSPSLPKQQSEVMSNVKVWCHPFRQPMDHFLNPNSAYYLLPESDFMDAKLVVRRDDKIKYDFFYMTLDDKAGFKHKGLQQFIDSLPILCGKCKLTGLVIVYFPAAGRDRSYMNILSKQNRQVIDKYSNKLKFIYGWQNQDQLAQLMGSCRFGFFPNTMDCSPRLIPECLLRNKPIILNESIWGGWHYINENTGSYFKEKDNDSLLQAISHVLSNNFNTVDIFMSQYGFKKSSARFASILSEHFDEAKAFTNIYFSVYKKVMPELLK